MVNSLTSCCFGFGWFLIERFLSALQKNESPVGQAFRNVNNPVGICTLTLSALHYSTYWCINALGSVLKSFCLYNFSHIDGYKLEMYDLISLPLDFSECIPMLIIKCKHFSI